MRDLQAITTFIAVARAGSFAEAARRLGLSTTAASRHVAELEQTLGVTLLHRTTRSVRLTEGGSRYLSRAETIVNELDNLNAEISADERSLRGTLRISAPPGIGRDWIVPLAIDFMAAYPGIDLDLDLRREWRAHDRRLPAPRPIPSARSKSRPTNTGAPRPSARLAISGSASRPCPSR
jgi:molybdate transport repressor ModE-like protein